ncbi:MAG: hypothetical protein ACRCST_00625 [Turicibacter sp.]
MLKNLNKTEQVEMEIKLGVKPFKEFLTPDKGMNCAINAFLNGTTGKFEKGYFALPNALVHRRLVQNENGIPELKQSIIALIINGVKVGNSSILPWLGARVSFGRLSQNRNISKVQTKLGQHCLMVPFTVFEESGLDIRTLKVVDKGPEETIKVNVDNPDFDFDKPKSKTNPKNLVETRHFTGAALMSIENKTYLFDMDRNEIKHKIFNPFMVEIPKQVETIEQAYQALKPIQVVEAEAKGLKVLRQGEFFFIPVKGEFESDKTVNNWGDDNGKVVDKRMELQAGNNRPNYATKGIEKLGLVSGTVSHSGREHKDLKLVGWYKAVPNTSQNSFTLTGDID